MYRKLIHLASRELERSEQIDQSTPESRHHQELLEEFLVLGMERVLELVQRMSGEYFALLEQKVQARSLPVAASFPSPSGVNSR